MRILVVDDEPDIRDLFAHILCDDHHDVVEAADGVAAIEILKQSEAFDVVVTDRRMPRMNGPVLLQRMRELGFDMPVICVTGENSRHELAELRQLGFYSVVEKPVRLPHLLKEVLAAGKAGKSVAV